MSNVFAKVFSQIFDSTIAEDYRVRHIFMDLLVMADSDGVVDKTPQAISRIANIPLESVTAAIQALSLPDAASRTKDQDGRRIELVDDKRDWGWRIVNFNKYRDIRDEEARRIANRSYKREQRKRAKESAMSALSSDNQQRQPSSAKGEVEAEVEAEERSKADAPPEGLHPMQYAAQICDELVIPKKGNMETISEAIQALVASGKSGVSAYGFLLAKALDARDAGETVNVFWFRDGKFNSKVRGNDRPTASQRRAERIQKLLDGATAETPDPED